MSGKNGVKTTRLARLLVGLCLACALYDCGEGGNNFVGTPTGKPGMPCNKNGDCASSLCLPVGQPSGGAAGWTGSVCTALCTDGSQCAVGWSCGPLAGASGNVCLCQFAAEICDGKDNDCDGVVDNPIAADAWCADWIDWPNHNDTYGGPILRAAKMGGNPTLLVSNTSPDGFVLDATSLYWTTSFDTLVEKAPLAGGMAVPIAMMQGGPSGIAVDGSSVYWTDDGDRTVSKSGLGGGNLTVLAANQRFPVSIALDDKSVYYGSNVANGTLARVAKSGGDSVTLAVAQFGMGHVAVDGSSVYFIDGQSLYKVAR